MFQVVSSYQPRELYQAKKKLERQESGRVLQRNIKRTPSQKIKCNDNQRVLNNSRFTTIAKSASYFSKPNLFKAVRCILGIYSYGHEHEELKGGESEILYKAYKLLSENNISASLLLTFKLNALGAVQLLWKRA